MNTNGRKGSLEASGGTQNHTVRTFKGQKTHIERRYVPLRTQYVLLWTHLPTVRKVFTKVRTVFGRIRIV